MYPYFIMIGIPAIMAIIFNHFKYNTLKENRLVIDSFFLIWLVLLIFRSITVGIDLSTYKFHFENYSLVSFFDLFLEKLVGGHELGYQMLAKTVSVFTNDFHIVIAIVALISVIPIWKMYRSECKHSFLIVVLFVNIAPFTMYFSGLRQVLAMAFVPLCYRYCKEKKIVKFLLSVFLAFLFHRSSLILLLLYPVYHLRLKKQSHIFYIIPFIGLVYIFNVPIFRFFLLLLENGYGTEYGGGVKATGAYAVLLLLCVILIYTFLISDTEKLDNDTVGLRNILILCVLLQTFSGVHTIAMRMNYYFLLFVPLLIPKVIEAGKEKYAPLIKFSVICMVCFFTVYYFYYAYTDADILNVYPYDSLIKDYRLGY